MNEKQKEIREKFMAFSVRAVNLKKYLNSQMKEYNMADQIQRSGTAIGALQREAFYAESEADMIHKLKIAIKEANETDYWLELLLRTDYISSEQYDSMHADLLELEKILSASIATIKKRNTHQSASI